MTLSDDGGKLFERVSNAFQTAAKWLYDKKTFTPDMLSEPEPVELIKATHDVLASELSAIGFKIPDEMTQTLDDDIFLFSGFKTYHEMNDASRLLKDDDGGFKPFGSFLQDIQSIDSQYNQNYLYAEYNFAKASTQMAVKWHDIEMDGDDYNLQYRTASDGLVRPEHAALEGVTLPPSDKFWDEYYPPNGWNCRCTAVQVLKDKYAASDSDQACAAGERATTQIGKNGANKAEMFRFNPGKAGKIFPPKHPYYKAPDTDLIRANIHRNNVLQEVISNLQKSGIDYLKPEKMEKIPDEGDIIKKIAGADLTEGSCSSLAFAYVGNKSGFDVTDHRGGNSCKFFCLNSNITKIVEKAGGIVVKNANDFRATAALLKQTKEGKEYYFSTGEHAAIIRKNKSGFEYLELQSDKDNGWHTLTTEKLKSRFKAQKSHTSLGLKLEATSHLIEIEKLGECDDFKDLLGYINTSTGKQQKGAGGGIK